MKENIEKTVELNLFAFPFGNWNKKRVTIERIAPVDCGKFREIDRFSLSFLIVSILAFLHLQKNSQQA